MGDESMNEYMKIAKELSDQNLKTKDGGPFGACIVKNGLIIGKGSNNVLKNNDPTAHAEVMAIRKASEKLGTHDLSKCILYATGYPCPMCLSAIIWANIRKVYYGTNLREAEEIGFRDDFIYEYLNGKNKDILDIEGLCHDGCKELFNEYKDKNKEIY